MRVPMVLMALFLLAGCGGEGPPNAPPDGNRAEPAAAATPSPAKVEADVVKVRLDTDAGAIILAIDAGSAHRSPAPTSFAMSTKRGSTAPSSIAPRRPPERPAAD